jgi:hypothetical protein
MLSEQIAVDLLGLVQPPGRLKPYTRFEHFPDGLRHI